MDSPRCSLSRSQELAVFVVSESKYLQRKFSKPTHCNQSDIHPLLKAGPGKNLNSGRKLRYTAVLTNMPIRNELKTDEKRGKYQDSLASRKKFNNSEKCIKKAFTTIAYSLDEEEYS